MSNDVYLTDNFLSDDMCDWFMSFHPQLPNFICKVYRDDKYISVLESQIQRLLEMLEEAQEKIGEMDGVR